MSGPLRFGGMGLAHHLYVHAPFCARRCPYCDFSVTVRRQGGHSDWIRSLSVEVDRATRDGELGQSTQLRSLYVGGGTPSLLGEGAMPALADLLGGERLAHPRLEWTCEANPESFTSALAEDWRHAGVNRVSLGVQTFHGPALHWMGRLHGADGAQEAVTIARRAGIENLSIDLIFGLPAHLNRDLDADLDLLLGLDLPHVSLYGLGVEKGTPLARWIEEGREAALDEEVYREEYLHISDRLTRAGYHHYEVSNFARPDRESVHNRAYWEGSPYLGLGNSSHSYLPPVRRWNLRDWNAYSEAVLDGRSPVESQETILGPEALLESVWLGLRTSRGLILEGLAPQARTRIEGWVLSSLAEVEGDRVRLTPHGWLLLDRLAVDLAQDLSPRGGLAD